MNKFLAFAFAGMALAACSNEDSPANGGDQQGEIVDAISVKFVNSTSTRADQGTEAGLEQENKLYHAFVFAKEATPAHAGARPGDWTVIEVGDGTAAIPATSSSGSSLGNMATFNGVRQGDNVYVLANYPDLDAAGAEVLAHNGENSEASIKAFIANVQKDYLNGLAFSSKSGEGAAPASSSKYIMAGVATIPVSPNIPNGTKVVVPVKLDREMAKVFFQASVTKDAQYAAAGKVKLDTDDGIIVARVARKVSPFTTQDGGWYFPTSAVVADKDWNIAGWLKAFDGNAKSADDNAQAVAPFFNNAAHNADAKEFRYTWDASASSGVRVYQDGGWMFSPYFYVTPNYSNNAASATVISTQATYCGAPEFMNGDAQMLFVKAFGKYAASSASDFQDKDGANTTVFSKCVWTNTAITKMNQYFANAGSFTDAVKGEVAVLCGWTNDVGGKGKVDAAVAELAKVTKVIGLDPTNDATIIANLSYYDGMKLYYRADIANYDAANTVSLKNTERNTYYKIRATITSLGAKSIEDAINSDDISMQVEVTVNPWNVVFNDINM